MTGTPAPASTVGSLGKGIALHTNLLYHAVHMRMLGHCQSRDSPSSQLPINQVAFVPAAAAAAGVVVVVGV